MRPSSVASPSGSHTCRAILAIPRRTSAWGRRSGTPPHPCSTSRSRHVLFGRVVKGLADAGLTNNARVVVEKPFGSDTASARALADELHQYVDESQLLRIDHYLGKMGLEEIIYLRFANAILEPVWNRNFVASVQITMAEDFGVEDRRRLLRSGRGTPRRRRQPPHAGSRGGGHGGARGRRSRDDQGCAARGISCDQPGGSRHYVRGQYDGYRSIDGVAADSTTETYCALRLEVENWRWSGVPFFIRTGKRLPITQTELRLVFRQPPRLGFANIDRHPESNQIVIKLDPSTGVRLRLDAHRGDTAGAGEITFDVEFAAQGGEGATPYEVLLHAAMVGDTSRFNRQDAVDECWRIMQPLLDTPGSVHPYAPGSWGPSEAEKIVAGHGHWHEPWVPA